MWKLIQLLIFGHEHKWETASKVQLDVTSGGRVVETGTRYVLRCTHCGIVKKVDLV